jgi:hypothetical protein
MAGRPLTHPVKKMIRFDEELNAAIEAWCRKQKAPVNFSEAVRQLIARGLRTSKDR